MTHAKQIDGLRFFSFLAVFLFHCYPLPLWFGAYGVHLFFTLSGFLITYLLMTSEGPGTVRTVAVFYGRRALRIFPAYYTAIALMLPFGTLVFPKWQLAYLFNWRVFQESTQGHTGHLFQGWESSGVHFWSLCVEEQFYLTYPWILLLVPRASRKYLLAGIVLLGAGSRAFLEGFFPTTLYGLLLPVCAEYLAWGGLAAILVIEGKLDELPNSPVLWGGLVTTLALCLVPRPAGTPVELQFQPGPFQTLRAVAFTALILGLWRDATSPVARFLQLRPLVYLGKISYGLYLYHLFVFLPWDRLVQRDPRFGHVPRPLALFALTVAAASFSWFLLEKPLNRLKDLLRFR